MCRSDCCLKQTTNLFFKMKVQRFGMMKHKYYSNSSVCVYIYYVAFKRINWLWNHPIWNQPHGILVQTPFSFSFQLSKPTLKEVQGVGRVRGEKKPVLADAPWRSNVERMVKRCGTGFLGNETSRRKSHSICQWKQILSSLLQYIFIATYNMWFGLCTETRRNRGFFSKKLT